MQSIVLLTLLAGVSASEQSKIELQKQHLEKTLEMLNRNLANFEKQDLKDPEIYELYQTTRESVKHAAKKLAKHQLEFPEAPTDWQNDDDEPELSPEAPKDWQNDDDEQERAERMAPNVKPAGLIEVVPAKKAADEDQQAGEKIEKLDLKAMQLKAAKFRSQAEAAQKKAEDAAAKVEASKIARQVRRQAIEAALKEVESPEEKAIEVAKKAIEEAQEDQEDLKAPQYQEEQEENKAIAKKTQRKLTLKKSRAKAKANMTKPRSPYHAESQQRKQENSLLIDEGKGTYGRFASQILGSEALPESPEAYHKRTHAASLLEEVPKVTLSLEETIAKREKELRLEALVHKKATENPLKAKALCGSDKACIDKVDKKLKNGVFDREATQLNQKGNTKENRDLHDKSKGKGGKKV